MRFWRHGLERDTIVADAIALVGAATSAIVDGLSGTRQ
jgi:hypothetical protein